MVKKSIVPVMILMKSIIKKSMYTLTSAVILPLIFIISIISRMIRPQKYVLHVGGPSHVLEHTVSVLRENGISADYLAIGENIYNKSSDFRFLPSRIPTLTVFREAITFLKVMLAYRIVHSHTGVMPSWSVWEMLMLRVAGRKIIVHFRGCEARNKKRNMQLHPHINICQACDSDGYACSNARVRVRRLMAGLFANQILVTTPDMKDFVPEALHMPFFSHPEFEEAEAMSDVENRPLRIAHVTGHPGIEGTNDIRSVVEDLQARGYSLELCFLTRVNNEEAQQLLRNSDIAIGKMKMGYYANFSIEALSMGVPCITWIQDRFLTPNHSTSGLIVSDLTSLTQTLIKLLEDRSIIEDKRAVSRSSILALHDNQKISALYLSVYQEALNWKIEWNG